VPAILVGPDPVPKWILEAVEAGGGRPIDDPAEAEAVVWISPRGVERLQAVLAEAPNATWVQLPWAGVEHFAASGVFSDGRTWTCGKGVYADPVAELALAMALAGLRQIPEWVTATSWHAQGGRSLYDGRVTVLGGGGITESLLRLLRPFRTSTTVVRRRPDPLEGADRTTTPDHLHEAIADADAVFVALALTPETRHVIDAQALAAMQPHAWLVNVARGEHVVTDDLVAALEDHKIGGAGLDVTDPEPLPDGHPLWHLDNCIITPHTGNTQAMARPLLSARIAENIRRFISGEQLIGLVDPDAGY
jgi:phosphoglycerate dehydrogenase-like enzyme